MLIKDLIANIATLKRRSTWDKGVQKYAIELLESYADLNATDLVPERENLEKALLSGAANWQQYSEGGCALIYTSDITERLYTPSERRRFRKDWECNIEFLKVQAEALDQAFCLIEIVLNRLEK